MRADRVADATAAPSLPPAGLHRDVEGTDRPCPSPYLSRRPCGPRKPHENCSALRSPRPCWSPPLGRSARRRRPASARSSLTTGVRRWRGRSRFQSPSATRSPPVGLPSHRMSASSSGRTSMVGAGPPWLEWAVRAGAASQKVGSRRALDKRLGTCQPPMLSYSVDDTPAQAGGREEDGGIDELASRDPSPTWRAFLAAHRHGIAAVDFFLAPTLTFRLLFGFVVLRHHRR